MFFRHDDRRLDRQLGMVVADDLRRSDLLGIELRQPALRDLDQIVVAAATTAAHHGHFGWGDWGIRLEVDDFGWGLRRDGAYSKPVPEKHCEG